MDLSSLMQQAREMHEKMNRVQEELASKKVTGSAGGCSAEPGEESAELPLGPTGKARADGARDTFLGSADLGFERRTAA